MAKCMFPYMVERKIYFNQEDKFVPVPCGKCPTCLKRRLASWSFRLEVESLNWSKQFFVTLTYDTEFVPISPNGFLTLDKTHPTKFFKRLRNLSGRMRYYLCGEYGTRRKRPHYHLILFGTDRLHEDDIVSCWTDPETKRPYGNVYFGKVEAGSIRYTVQYYDKGEWQPQHRRDDRVPEFSRMSKGIGSSFLTPKMVRYFLANPDTSYIYDKEGRKIAIPQYYKKRLYDYVMSRDLVSSHPSILIHRDEMQDAKEVHHEAIAEIMSKIEVPEETETLNEDRKAAIINYRNSKRKTRK